AGHTGLVEFFDGLHERGYVHVDLARQFFKRVRLRSRKDRRHEAANGLGVDDGPRKLPRLHGNAPAPDRLARRPADFGYVIEAVGLAVDHDAQRYAIDTGADPAIIEGGARVNGDAMRLRRVADDIGTGIHHVAQQYALVVTPAANQEVVRRPFAALVLAPGLAQPFAIRF